MLAATFLISPQAFAIGETKASIQNFDTSSVKIKQGSVLSLNDCIGIALNNSATIKQARYNYGISKANVGIARSEFFPTIGVGTGYNYTDTHTKR